MNQHPSDKASVFKIRSYGFSELAQLYFPAIASKSAASRLRCWISSSSALQEKLAGVHYEKGQRLLTPLQVAVLIEHLGIP